MNYLYLTWWVYNYTPQSIVGQTCGRSSHKHAQTHTQTRADMRCAPKHASMRPIPTLGNDLNRKLMYTTLIFMKMYVMCGWWSAGDGGGGWGCGGV